jgi:hypothetical protein
MSMCKVSCGWVFIAVAWIFYTHSAYAEWRPDSIQVSGGDCVVRESKVDETKITILFYDFLLSLRGQSGRQASENLSCSFDVEFRIPANHRLKNLSNRIFVKAEKDKHSALSLDAAVAMNGTQFSQTGKLLMGNGFSGRLLLYKSFDVKDAADCSPADQYIHLRTDLSFGLEIEPDSRGAMIDMSGETEWIDLWLDVERC